MDYQKHKKQKSSYEKISRREFLQYSGTIVFIVGTGFYVPAANGAQKNPKGINERRGGIPPSQGYLLVDIKKCQGCTSCMLACTLVHEGVQNPSLSRIQIIQNSFECFPDDVTIEQCRQCVEPACVEACPEGALKASAKFANVRVVDRAKCIGCGECVEACPYTPSRPIVVSDKDFGGDKKSRKCDLCANTPYHWDKAGGGPQGKQACVEVCPVGAIKFTKEIPLQKGDEGYMVNLRDTNWAMLGYPTD